MNDLRNVFGEGAHWIQNQCFLCWRHAVHENKRKPTTEQTGRKAANELGQGGGGVAGPEGGWLDGWMGGRGRGGCCCCGSGNKAPLGRQNAPIDKSCRAIWAVEHLSWRRQNTNANACRSSRSCIFVFVFVSPCAYLCERIFTSVCVSAKNKQQRSAAH